MSAEWYYCKLLPNYFYSSIDHTGDKWEFFFYSDSDRESFQYFEHLWRETLNPDLTFGAEVYNRYPVFVVDYHSTGGAASAAA